MKEIGTEWWYFPFQAGYGAAWKPEIARIVALVTEPTPPGAPLRQYIVRLEGGTQLFANDDALRYINATRTGPHMPVTVLPDGTKTVDSNAPAPE